MEVGQMNHMLEVPIPLPLGSAVSEVNSTLAA